MIRNLSDFFKKLIDQESAMLAKQEIKHPGIIGQMYEGLTKELLNKIIPEQLNLNIASGIITNSNGMQSRQIDCMVFVGEGERIPYTDEFKYDIQNVFAVIA